MKAMEAKKDDIDCEKSCKPMTYTAIIKEIAQTQVLPVSVIKRILDQLKNIAHGEIAATGTFVLPQLVTLKATHKPPTMAGKKRLFGKETHVKVKPAQLLVKATPAQQLVNAAKGLHPRVTAKHARFNRVRS